MDGARADGTLRSRAVRPSDAPAEPVSTLARLTTALADRYRVERELGAGGMATVYLAHDIKHERDVAIKVLHPDLGAALGSERFLSEIRTTARLQHPHILPLLDSGAADGLLYYVMPYVTGETLRARLERERQLPIDEALRIAREVANALEHAHKQGIIHRDVKPENILLQDGAAVVADFGIALAVQSAGGARMTQTGLSLGTPQYMSPEQAMGERTIDARSDIYALGAVTYEMLAGEPPFSGSSTQAIVAKVLTERPTPLRTTRDTVPSSVDDAVLQALAKLPADRWTSAAEFARSLTAKSEKFIAVTAPSAAARTPTTRWRVAVALVVGVGIGAAAWPRPDGANRATSQTSAEPRFYQISLPDTAPFVAGIDEFGLASTSVAITGDGRTLAYLADTPSGQSIALVRLDRGSTTVLPGTNGGIHPTFSPDGQSVAFGADKSLKKIALGDGTVSTLASVGWLTGIVWSPNGRIYVSGSEGGSRCLAWVPEAGGAVTTVIPRCNAGTMSPIGADARTLLLHWLSESVFFDTRTDSVVRTPFTGPGTGPLAMSSDRLLIFRDDALYAMRMDAPGARFVGDPIKVMSNVRREAWTGHAHAALSHDGTLVWASGDDAAIAKFVWLDRTGALQDTALDAAAIVTSFALSPDANRLAYSTVDGPGRQRLLIADLRRRITDEIPFDGGLLPLNWIRNGRALSVSVFRPNRPPTTMLVDFSGATVRIDSASTGSDESRDGTQRCFDVAAVQLSQVRAGTAAIVDSVGGDWCRFSPDGTRLVYKRAIGLFVVNTTGPIADSRVQVAPADADEGRWSDDGRTIYYRRANRWYSIDAPSADMRPDATPTLLFTGRYLQALASWDRARDGRYLVLQGGPPVRLKTLNVMTNFPALVEEKLKAAEMKSASDSTTR
jgi:eukaryotic-like serine/threonine-protein kinase